jgi:hypothetical protein
MEKLETITLETAQIDIDRDVVNTVWLEFCHRKDVGIKDLMLFAYRRGKTDGRIEALDETLQSLRSMKNARRPDDEPESVESIYDRFTVGFDYAAQVDDPIVTDRRAIAREWSGR